MPKSDRVHKANKAAIKQTQASTYEYIVPEGAEVVRVLRRKTENGKLVSDVVTIDLRGLRPGVIVHREFKP